MKAPHLQTLLTPPLVTQKEHSGEKHLCTISTPIYSRRFNLMDVILCTNLAKVIYMLYICNLARVELGRRGRHQNNL